MLITFIRHRKKNRLNEADHVKLMISIKEELIY